MGLFDKPKLKLPTLLELKRKHGFALALNTSTENFKDADEVKAWKYPYPAKGLVLVSATKDIPSLVTEAGPVRAGQVVIVDAEYAHANTQHLTGA